MEKLRKIVGFLVWLLIPFAAASVGALYGPDAWYESLSKPAWTPPGYVFGAVWSLLYAMMGVAAEQEFSTEDRLVISRVLFIGGESLLRAKGLARWWPEGPNKPLWEVVSGLARPPVCAVRVINGSA